ncbi:MAG: hypothetical protein WDW38_004023 [Sanguina aurantia]
MVENLQHDLAGEQKISSTIEAQLQHAVKANSSLIEQVADLRDTNSGMSGAAESLVQQMERLCAERDAANASTAELRSQLDALQRTRLLESADHAAQVQALKAEVSSIVNRLLSRGCSEADAASALAELGCELLFVDEQGEPQAALGSSPAQQELPEGIASSPCTAPWDGQSGLLLDDRQRIQRLMASCSATRSSLDGRTSTIAFPHLRQQVWGLLSGQRLGAAKDAGSSSAAAAAAAQAPDAPRLNCGASDTTASSQGGRDQQPINIIASPANKRSSKQQQQHQLAGKSLFKLPVTDDQRPASSSIASHSLLAQEAHSLFDAPGGSFGSSSGPENDLISSMTRDMALL